MNSKFLLQLKLTAFVWLFVCMAFVQKSLGQITHTTIPLTPTTAPYGSEGVIYVLQVSETNAFPFPYSLNSLSITVNSTVSFSLNSTYKAYLSNDNLFDNSDSQLSQVQSLTILGDNTIGFSVTGASIDLQSPKYLIFTGSFAPPLPTEGGRKSALLASVGTIKINGATNPVTATYSSIFFPPSFPIGITNNQSDTPGLTLDPDASTVTGGTPILPPTTLIANYTFCGNANDATSNAHNGVANGVTAVEDRHGNAASAYSFDGQDDVIDLGNWFTLQNFSISMWLKPGSTQGAFANIIDNNHSGSSQNWVCQQDNTSLNSYGFGTMSTGSFFTLTANQWQQLVLVKSPTALETYINGVLVQSTPYSNGPINYSNQYLRLGNWGGGGRHWNGVMDDVKIYNGPLTASEIATNYTEENMPTIVNCGPQPTTLVGNYTFCGNANDTSPNANNGTVNGATLTTDRFGNINSAYSFDGNDHIAIASNAALQLGTGDYSLSYWMKTNSPGINQGMIMKMDGGNGYAGFTQYHMGGNLQARSQNAEALNTTTGGLNDNNWHHIVYLRSGNSQKLYVDGSLNTSNITAGIANVSNSQPMHFGKWNEVNDQYYFGALDDIKIYSGALTESEITAEYNATAACTTCPPNTTIVVTGDNVNNQCTASSILQASGGTAPYTYTVSTAGASITNGILTGPSGTYTVTAFDANGCSGTAEITLTASDNTFPVITNYPSDRTVVADANCTKVVSWTPPVVFDNCPPPAPQIEGLTYMGNYLGKNYYFTNNSLTYDAAKAFAAAQGGYLASLLVPDEQNFVKTLPNYDGKGIGLTDREVEGQFLWDSGEPFIFDNWNSGEPNNASGGQGEDFVVFSGNGWNDTSSEILQYIIELPNIILEQTEGLPSGSAFPTGITTNTFKAIDATGNETTISFIITVEPFATASITYNANAFCKNEASQLPTITGAQGGTFSFIPPPPLLGEDDPIGAGGEPSPLVLSIDPNSGAINPVQSDPGVYTVVYTVAASGPCPAITANFTVQIKSAPVIDCPTNIEVCKNSPIINLPNIPSGAIVSVGGVANTSGTFDPSATWPTNYLNENTGNIEVPVVYTLSGTNGCSNICTYKIIVKYLPNPNTNVYFDNNNGSNTKTVCVNSGDQSLIFDGGFGSQAPFTFTYTVNNGPEQQIVSPGIALAGINLSTATAGTFVYKLTKVKVNSGCEADFNKTATLTVNELPTFTLSGGDTFCEGENTATSLTVTSATSGTITGTLTDGTSFSGTSPIQVTVNPNATTNYQIQTINGTTCPPNFSGSATVTVNPKPAIDCGSTLSVCEARASFVLSSASPAGGVYSGNGVNNDVFNPASAGIGTHIITYNYIDPVTGCSNSCTFSIEVTATPTASFYYPSPIVCKSVTNLVPTNNGTPGGNITVSPENGLNIGINGIVNPSASTAGTYTITYTIPQSADFCPEATTSFTLTIEDNPAAPSLTQTPATCTSATGSISITAPLGNGLLYKLDDGQYQAEATFGQVSTGSHTVTVTNAAGCTSSATITVLTDNTVPTVNCPANSSLCLNDSPVTFTGGVYTGVGVTNNIFDPSIAGVGTHSITKTVTNVNNGCTASCTFSLTVNGLFSIIAQATSPLQVCEGSEAGFQFLASGASQGATGFTVNYNKDGGNTQSVSTTNGIAGVIVDTSVPGTYTYNFLGGGGQGDCPSAPFGSLTFVVKAKPAAPSCPANMTATTTDAAFSLTGAMPTGGVYAGTGVSAGMFNPATAGVGIHTITYTITGENGCQNTCSFTITVSGACENTLSSLSYTAATVCEGVGPSLPPTLVGTSGGIYTASPTGLSINSGSGLIDPTTSAAGMYTVTYTLAATNNCPEKSTTATVSVLPKPTISTFTAQSVCQPFDIPLSFTGLVPNSVNEIKLGVKEVLVPANAYADRVVNVTADASGNGTASLSVTAYGSLEYQLSLKEIKMGDCNFIPENKTANFTKKPRGGGQSVDILETTVCSGATLNGIISTVPNLFPTNFGYEIKDLATNAIVLSNTGVALPSTGNTLAFSIGMVVLPAGNYRFSIVSQDIDGCGTTTSISDNFAVHTAIMASATQINLNCSNSAPTGSIDLTVTGGTGNYTYLWNNNEQSQDLSNLAAGNYSVEISDGCSVLNKSYTITKPAALVINTSINSLPCGNNLGSVVISTTGGTSPYSYSVSTGGTLSGNTLTAPAGSYTITVTDGNGCTGSTTIVLSDCSQSAFSLKCYSRLNLDGVYIPAPSGTIYGNLYITLIQSWDRANGAILGVYPFGDNAEAFIPNLPYGNYTLIFTTNPMGSRTPNAPIGYVFEGEKVIVDPSKVGGTFGPEDEKIVSTNLDEVADGVFYFTNEIKNNGRIASQPIVHMQFAFKPSGPLPIRLESFTGKPTEKGNQLNWKTSAEVNFSHFEIERSSHLALKGRTVPESFEKIGEVKGNKGENYEFIDNSAFRISNSPLVYYRLRMVDLDGKFGYSQVISIKTNGETAIKVYPNPASEFIYLENIPSKNFVVKLIDAQGRVIASYKNTNKIALDKISNGGYFVQILSNEQNSIKKVLIQK